MLAVPVFRSASASERETAEARVADGALLVLSSSHQLRRTCRQGKGHYGVLVWHFTSVKSFANRSSHTDCAQPSPAIWYQITRKPAAQQAVIHHSGHPSSGCRGRVSIAPPRSRCPHWELNRDLTGSLAKHPRDVGKTTRSDWRRQPSDSAANEHWCRTVTTSLQCSVIAWLPLFFDAVVHAQGQRTPNLCGLPLQVDSARGRSTTPDIPARDQVWHRREDTHR